MAFLPSKHSCYYTKQNAFGKYFYFLFRSPKNIRRTDSLDAPVLFSLSFGSFL